MGEGRGTQDKRGAWGREGTQEKRRGRGDGRGHRSRGGGDEEGREGKQAREGGE